MSVIRDEDGAIKTAHYSLIRRYPLDKLEREVLELLTRKRILPLSKIWKNFDCHLWELNYVLKRLKEKGLSEERDYNSQ